MFTKIMAIQQPASVPVRPVPPGILPQIAPIVTELQQIIPRLEDVSPSATDSATIITGIKDASKFVRIMQQISVVINGLMKADERRDQTVGKDLVGPVCYAIADCGSKNENEKDLLSLFRRESPEIADKWFVPLLPFFFFSTDGNAQVPSKSDLLLFCVETKTRMEQINGELFEIRRKLDLDSRQTTSNDNLVKKLEGDKVILQEEIDALFEKIKTSPKVIPKIYTNIALKACFKKEILEAYIQFFKSVKELLKNYANNTGETVVFKMPVIAKDGTVSMNKVEITDAKQFVDEMGLSNLLRVFIQLRTIIKESSKNILFGDVKHGGEDIPAQRQQVTELMSLKKELAECSVAVSAISKLVMSSDMTTLEKFTECTTFVEEAVPRGPAETVFPFLTFNIISKEGLQHNSELLTTVIEQYFKATPEERIEMDVVLSEIVVKKPTLQKAIKLIKEIGTKNEANDFSGVSISLNDGIESFLKKKGTGDEASLFNIALLHVLHVMSSDKELVKRYKNTILNLSDLSSASLQAGYPEVDKLSKGYISEIIQKLCSTLKDFYGHEDFVRVFRRSIDLFLDAYHNPTKLRGKTPAETTDSILIVGGFGTGKTFYTLCVANEYRLARKVLNVTKIVERAVQEGGNNEESIMRRIDEIFDDAAKESKNRPVLFFIDECDGFSRDRQRSSEVQMRMTNYTLTKIDDFRLKYRGIFFAGATNYFDEMDRAMTREGRFDLHLTLEIPTVEEHMEMIRGIIEQETNITLSEEQILVLAKASQGLTHLSVEKSIIQVSRFKPEVTFEAILESIKHRKEHRRDSGNNVTAP